METISSGRNRLFQLFFKAIFVFCICAGASMETAHAFPNSDFNFKEIRLYQDVYSFNAGAGPEARLQHQQLLTGQSKSLNRTNIDFALSSEDTGSARQDTVPHPRNVMFRSMLLPGWGQYTNRQAWKIPIVYALIGGVAYYSWFSDTRYRGYRAAFYNSNPENTDFRFGATPDWINPNASAEFLRESRNFHRNRRDFLIIATVLSYGLNVLDAYVFAHMRDFDVSDDLSERRIEVGSSTFTAASAPVPLLSVNLRF